MAAWDSSSHTSIRARLLCGERPYETYRLLARRTTQSRQGVRSARKHPSEAAVRADLRAWRGRICMHPPKGGTIHLNQKSWFSRIRKPQGPRGANRGLVVFLSRHYPAAPPPFSFLVPQSRRFVRFGRSAEPSDRRATWLAKRSAIARIRRFVHDRRMPKMAASSRHGARPPRRLLAELSKVVMLQL